MTHRILTLRAGQTGRLRVTVTAPTGADTTLAGAVCVSGVHRPMQASGSDLLVGAMPPGMWLYEVRCGGVTVLYGHIEVAPSPLADDTGEVGWHIAADLAADVASVTVTLAEGLPGRDGAPGRDGRDGTDGATPEIGATGAWVIGGVDTGRPSVEVIDPVLGTCYEQAAAWDAVIHWAEIDGSLVSPGQVAMIEIPCQPNGSAQLTESPIWMTIYEADGSGGWTYLATSANAVIQRVGVMSRWRYTGVPLTGGRNIRLCPVASPDVRWDATLALGSGGRPRGAESGGHVTLATGERSAVRLAATIRTIDGVSAHGVRLVTHDDMAAYVADYVAAHAPAVDLSDYQGPIRLRDEHGEDVLVAVAGDLDARHVQIGDVVTVQRTCVTISSPLDVRKVHTYDQLDISAGSRVVISANCIYAMCRDEILIARGTMDSYSDHLRIDTSGYHAIGTEVLISGAHICISPDPYYPAPGYSPSIDVSLSNVTISADHYLWLSASGGLHTAGVLSLAPTGDILTS